MKPNSHLTVLGVSIRTRSASDGRSIRAGSVSDRIASTLARGGHRGGSIRSRSGPALPLGVPLKCLIAAGFSIAVTGSLVRQASAAALEPPAPTEEAAALPEYFPLPPGTVFQKVVVGADAAAAAAAGESERLIYSNTLGINIIRLGSERLTSDDITTTAPVGCNLARFSFKVAGRVVPADPGGPYTVRYALYDTCPQSVPTAMRTRFVGDPAGGIIIPGTNGEITFPDDAPRLVEHIVADPSAVPIPTSLWLGISFTRANCGTIVGAPAMVGHSADVMDYQGALACSAFFGGFPEQPHTSFWAEMYGGANCPESFVAYKAARVSATQYSAGSQVPFLDDIKLIVNNCQMIGYEVAVKGYGFYRFDLVRDCGDPIGNPAIPGTDRWFIVNLNTQPQLQLARFAFDPPIPLNTDSLYFRFIVNNSTGGVVKAGIQPTIGTSSEDYFRVNWSGGCEPVYPPSGSTVSGVFHASITCAGSLPVGACCDMALTQCVGGPDDGKPCRCKQVCRGGSRNGWCCTTDSDCTAPGTCEPYCTPPGTCESVCREVPRINCPWPPKGWAVQPAWVEGATCASDPFPKTCGVAACCLPDDTCENLTQNVCLARAAPGEAILWQPGAYCAEGAQVCPFNACLRREGQCHDVHEGAGCNNPFCCTDVCEQDPWCCHVDWDRLCVAAADELCYGANHDHCTDIHGSSALEVGADGTTFFGNNGATESATDPGFCCNANAPGAAGYGSVWFKFVATDESVQIDTCYSDPAGDSLVNVFSVGDPTDEVSACQSLTLIACGDNGCSNSGRHSLFCADGLTPGATYYIMLASKTPEAKGTHLLELKSPCQCAAVFPSGDCNLNGQPDGCDLIAGTSDDCDENQIPDECDSAGDSLSNAGFAPLQSYCPPLLQKFVSDQQSESFGFSLDTDGEWLLVGDPSGGYSSDRHAGKVYVYRRSGRAWSHTQTLTSPNPITTEYFGYSIAVSDDWAILTAPDYYGSGDRPSGTAYTYKRIDDTWIFQGTLPTPPDDDFYWWTWYQATLDGNLAAVAVLSSGYIECGGRVVVYLFRRNDDAWTFEARIPEPTEFNSCGFAMGLSGDVLALTSVYEYGSDESDFGEGVRIFEKTSTRWQRTAGFPVELINSPGSGPPMAVQENTIVVPGYFFNVLMQQWRIVGHVFGRASSTWTLDTIIPPGGDPYYWVAAARFCRPGLLALLVGSTGSMGVEFHQRSPGGLWNPAGFLPIPDWNPETAWLSLAASVDSLAVGGALSSSDTSPYSGTVYSLNVPSTDCDADGIADRCELRDGLAEDCNHNFAPDECEQRSFGDFDFSGRVDLRDFAGLQRCFTRNDAPLAPCCGIFDLGPRDGDVDLGDAAAFPATMTGP